MASCSKSPDDTSSSTLLSVKGFLDDDADAMQCRLCNKTFYREAALKNHARMEHYEVYATGDPDLYTYHIPDHAIKHVAVETKKKAVSIQKNIINKAKIKKRTKHLVSSMKPTSLLSLASKDVPPKNVQEGDDTSDKSAKPSKTKPVKEIKHITGPFECFQPSYTSEDGLCHQIFLSCCEYSIHYRDIHTKLRKCLQCQVCEKPLTPGVEDPEHPYPCHICGDSFQTSNERTAHINTAHVKRKPYQCSVCKKRFVHSGGLSQHMRIHTGDRPFACTFCEKTFVQKAGLEQHLMTHTKVKPFKCVVCDKAFSQRIHLKQHMRTHTNVAPFQCTICQKSFKQSGKMNNHLRVHGSADMTKEQKKKYAELLSIMDIEGNIETLLDSEGIEQLAVDIKVQVESVEGGFTEIS